MTDHDVTGLSIVAGVVAVAAIVTWGTALLAGRRIARRRPLLAYILTTLVAPVALLGFGIVRFRIDSAAHPGSDWPVMAMSGTILFTFVTLATSLPVSSLALRRKKDGD